MSGAMSIVWHDNETQALRAEAMAAEAKRLDRKAHELLDLAAQYRRMAYALNPSCGTALTPDQSEK
jgi:hypothetical protein